MLRYLVLLAAAVTVAQAIVCPKDYCERVDCAKPKDCQESNGLKVREKGSFCQCCDICVKLLGEGERCVPEGRLMGVIITSECATGLYCEPTLNKCVRSVV